MGVVDLDEDYMPRGPPTIINPDSADRDLQNIEDVRLFVFRGQLLLVFQGMQRMYLPDGTRVRVGARSPCLAAHPPTFAALSLVLGRH